MKTETKLYFAEIKDRCERIKDELTKINQAVVSIEKMGVPISKAAYDRYIEELKDIANNLEKKNLEIFNKLK